MVAAAVHAMARRQKTRKALDQKVQELTEQLAAAGGETRKNLRNRVARLSKQVKLMEPYLSEEQRAAIKAEMDKQ